MLEFREGMLELGWGQMGACGRGAGWGDREFCRWDEYPALTVCTVFSSKIVTPLYLFWFVGIHFSASFTSVNFYNWRILKIKLERFSVWKHFRLILTGKNKKLWSCRLFNCNISRLCNSSNKFICLMHKFYIWRIYFRK